MARLVLWDVDHTLIENAGVSKEIYGAAFAALTGRQPSHLAPTEGRTDPDIMEAMFRLHDAAPVAWSTVKVALERAGEEHHSALAERGTVLPGVSALVAALAARDDVVQTVVTGNIRANAEVKLSALGLAEALDLDVGGYGSDSRLRPRLVEVARRRAAAKYGSDFGDAANAIVIGDTPRDVEAAAHGGARVLAVASGVHDVDELRAAGAGYVVPSLADTDAIVTFVVSPLTTDSRARPGTL
ncbi:MAG TPA: haloacid dehalogenase-like hydrolase [Jatrophihabitantaceae bacterium]|jgi:phosphoglycolate phosphatase-like HAD superfamily hydrolase